MILPELRKKYIDTLDYAQAFQMIVDDDSTEILYKMLKDLYNIYYRKDEHDLTEMIQKVTAYVDEKLSKAVADDRRLVLIFIRERHTENEIESVLHSCVKHIEMLEKRQDELNHELVDIKNRYVKPVEPVIPKLPGAPVQEFKVFTGKKTFSGEDTTAFKLVKHFNSLELNTEIDVEHATEITQKTRTQTYNALESLTKCGILTQRDYGRIKLYHAEHRIKWN